MWGMLIYSQCCVYFPGALFIFFKLFVDYFVCEDEPDEQEQLNVAFYFKKYSFHHFYKQHSNDATEINLRQTDWHVMCIVFGSMTQHI